MIEVGRDQATGRGSAVPVSVMVVIAMASAITGINRSVQTELESLGHRFATGTDTEVVVNAYARWGARAVERQLRAVPVNLRMVNDGLTDAATVLPGLSDTIDRRTGRRTA